MISRFLPALLAAAIFAGTAATAFADRDDWRHHHHHRHWQPVYVAPAPVYAPPPPVVYAPPPPPPVYVAPGINLSFHIH